MSGYLDELSEKQQGLLDKFGFDREVFEALRDRYAGGDWSPEDNRLKAQVEQPGEGDIEELPEPQSQEAERLREVGRQALSKGEVGLLVLNGGMATRFGSVVKGCVEVFDGQSFLGLKLQDAARWSAPVLLMNSFSTDEATKAHLEQSDYFGTDPDRVLDYTQNISLRLTPSGELFGVESDDLLYAPGHGDVAEATRRAALEEFQARGGRYLLMSNVDNVLASLDPLVVGSHIDAAKRDGVEMSVESVDNQGSTTGGMPARVDGQLQVVEAFRFPEGFDASGIPVYNTNTFIFNADALDQQFDLTWFIVEKEVGGRRAIQFERLAGELSAFLKTRFLQVPRKGKGSRFLPIKRREDLERNREFLQTVIEARRKRATQGS